MTTMIDQMQAHHAASGESTVERQFSVMLRACLKAGLRLEFAREEIERVERVAKSILAERRSIASMVKRVQPKKRKKKK